MARTHGAACIRQYASVFRMLSPQAPTDRRVVLQKAPSIGTFDKAAACVSIQMVMGSNCWTGTYSMFTTRGFRIGSLTAMRSSACSTRLVDAKVQVEIQLSVPQSMPLQFHVFATHVTQEPSRQGYFQGLSAIAQLAIALKSDLKRSVEACACKVSWRKSRLKR